MNDDIPPLSAVEFNEEHESFLIEGITQDESSMHTFSRPVVKNKSLLTVTIVGGAIVPLGLLLVQPDQDPFQLTFPATAEIRSVEDFQFPVLPPEKEDQWEDIENDTLSGCAVLLERFMGAEYPKEKFPNKPTVELVDSGVIGDFDTFSYEVSAAPIDNA